MSSWRKRRNKRRQEKGQEERKKEEKKEEPKKEEEGNKDPQSTVFSSQYGRKKKNFEDLDPKVQQLIIDTGTSITNEEDLAALSEISVQEKIMLFERIARGMSKKAALLEMTRELVKKRRERVLRKKQREEEYTKKMELYDNAENNIKEKLEQAEKDELAIKEEMQKTRDEIRHASSGKKMELQRELQKHKEKMDVIAELKKSGEDAREKLSILKSDAEQILKEDKERALKRLRRRETKDKQAFDESYKSFTDLFRKFERLQKGISEEEERRRLEEEKRKREEEERRRLAEIQAIKEEEERKKREEEERLRKAEEERRNRELARIRREEELRKLREKRRRELEFQEAVKQFDGYSAYLAEVRTNMIRDRKLLEEEKEKLLERKNGEDLSEFDEEYINYNLDLIERELKTIGDMENTANSFEETLVFLRKNRFDILNEEDKDKENELKEKEKEGIINIQNDKIDIEALMKKLDMMEDERCNRDFVSDYFNSHFEDYQKISQDKVRNCARDIQRKNQRIDEIEEELENEFLNLEEKHVLELKKEVLEREMEFTMELMKEAQEFMKKVEENKEKGFEIWGDMEMEQAEASESYQQKVIEKSSSCSKSFEKGFNFTPSQIERIKKSIKNEFGDMCDTNIAKMCLVMMESDREPEDIMESLKNFMSPKDAAELSEWLYEEVAPMIEEDEDFDVNGPSGKKFQEIISKQLKSRLIKPEVMNHDLPDLLIDIINGKPWNEMNIQRMFMDVGSDNEEALHSARWLFDEITRILLNDEEVQELEKKFEDCYKNGFEKMQKNVADTEKFLEDYLEKSKRAFNEFKKKMTGRVEELDLIEEEKEKRSEEMPKQVDLHSRISDWITSVLEKVSNDKEEKEKMYENLELKLQENIEDPSRKKVLEDKKEKLEVILKLLDDIEDKADDFDDVFQSLKNVACSMLICDEKVPFQRLRTEKQTLGEDYEVKFRTLLELMKKYEEFEEMDQGKKFAFFKRLEDIEGWSKKIKDHTEDMDYETEDVGFLLNESKRENTMEYHTDEERKGIMDRIDMFSSQNGDIEEIKKKIEEGNNQLGVTNNSNFAVYCCDDEKLFEEFKKKDYGEYLDTQQIMEELEKMMKEYEDKTMGRMRKRKDRYNRRRRRKGDAEELRKKELAEKMELLRKLAEKLSSCTDEGERRAIRERMKALLRQVRVLGSETIVQEFLSEVGWDVSDLSEEQKKLKLEFDGALDAVELMMNQKSESDIDKKLKKFRNQLLTKRDELQDKIKEKKDQIFDLEQKINSGDFAGKEVALMRFKKQCLEKQEAALRRLMDQFDELIGTITSIFKDEDMSEGEKARKLKGLIQKLKQYQQLMKDACRRAEQLLAQKREEFAFKKEEEFEDEDTLIFYIIDFKTTEYLNKQFVVAKRDPNRKIDKFLTSMLHRLYEVDFLGHRIKDMKTTNGKVLTHVEPENLLTVERYTNNPKGIRILTMEAEKSYELICKSNEEREILYSLISAIRPYVYSYCPSLCSKSSLRCLTTVKGFYSKPSHYKEDVPPAKRNPKFEGEFNLRVTRKPYEELMVWVGTWNLGGEKPPKNLLSKVMQLDKKFDIYCLCIQGGPFRNSKLLKEYFQDVIRPKARESQKFIVVNAEAIRGGSQIIILCNTETGLKVSNSQSSLIQFKKTKGNSVSVSMSVNETNFIFISSVFEEDNHKKKKANIDAKLQAYRQTLLGLGCNYHNMDLWSQYDYVFWGGDFGFHIYDKEVYKYLVTEKNEIDDLIDNEPLFNLKEEGKIFVDFEEPEINFWPNFPYKAIRGEPELCDDFKKYGNPSWRHRVFYKKLNPNYTCAELYYKANKELTVSPHLCTSSLYKLQTRVPYNTINEKRDKKYDIQFVSMTYKCDKIHAHDPIQKPKAFFYANFVESWGISSTSKERKTHNPTWKENELPTMVSSLPKHCLKDLYVIVAVRDGPKESTLKEGYQNLVVTGVVFLEEAVKALEYYGTYEFSVPAYHQGILTGKLEGQLFVKYHVSTENAKTN